MQHAVCLSLWQLAEAVELAEAALTVEDLFGGVLARLRVGKELASLARFVREWVCGNRIRVSEGDVRMAFVQMTFTSGSFCSRPDDHNRAVNVIRASSEKECVEHDQTVYANLEFGAQ